MRAGGVQRLALAAARAPRLTLALIVSLAAGGALLALGLQPSVSDSTLVSASSPAYRATQADRRAFGADAVVVLVRERPLELISTQDLTTISELEACLAGQVLVPDEQLLALRAAPAGALPAYGGSGGPCGQLMRHRPVQVVDGPGTFLNHAVAAVNEQLLALRSADQRAVAQAAKRAYAFARERHLPARLAATAALAAGELEAQQVERQLAQLAASTPVDGTPSIDSPAFLEEIVLDPSRGAGQPRTRLHYLFPTAGAALIAIRLKGDLDPAQSARAIGWIREAVAMKRFRLAHSAGYIVTGEPVLSDDLASQITASVLPLLAGALVAMALSLILVFGGTLRLVPLGIALAAASITFGIAALAGAALTMASIAVLPILIGLGVDYAIQFQSRARESSAPTARGAVAEAAALGAPAITAAALATAAGFLVLLLSPVPMVRGFGLLLVVGIAVALLCTFTAGPAALVLANGDLGASLPPTPATPLYERARSLQVSELAGRVARHPVPVLAAGLALALAGWLLNASTPVQSDITKLVPSGTAALRDLRTLERVSGSSGELDVIVAARDVATPRIVAWMAGYERTLLARYGYSGASGCAAATLCPALSLPDLLDAGAGAGGSAGSAALSARQIDALLRALPPYFASAVITGDRHYGVISFGIRLMPLAAQQRVLDQMRSQLHPPAGVSAELAGLPVLAAAADTALSSPSRRQLTLIAALAAALLALALALRRPARALVPLVPIALASGWSELVVHLLGTALNPLSAALGALVIAVTTEFSVLLSERYQQERRGGLAPAEALRVSYRRTGAAVLASGVTAIAGFGVLMLSDITMLRDFGLITLVDLSLSLCGVLLVLPAALAVTAPAHPARAGREGQAIGAA